MSNVLVKAKTAVLSPAGLVASGLATVLGVLAYGGIAGASTYDPTSNLTTFADSVGTTLGPIVVAVATALLGVAILFWGIRYAFSFVRGRH